MIIDHRKQALFDAAVRIGRMVRPTPKNYQFPKDLPRKSKDDWERIEQYNRGLSDGALLCLRMIDEKQA